MIEGCKHNIVAYLTAVSDGYASMILKMAAGIDKDFFTHSDILAVISIKWRKDAK